MPTPQFFEWFGGEDDITSRADNYTDAVFVDASVRAMSAGDAGAAIGDALQALPEEQRCVIDQSSMDQTSPNPADEATWESNAVSWIENGIASAYTSTLEWNEDFGDAIAQEMGTVPSIRHWFRDEEWFFDLTNIAGATIDAIWGDAEALAVIQSEYATLGNMSAATVKADGAAASNAWKYWFKTYQRGAAIRAVHAALETGFGQTIPCDNYDDMDLLYGTAETIYDINGTSVPVQSISGRSNRKAYIEGGNRIDAFPTIYEEQVYFIDHLNAMREAINNPRDEHLSLTAWLRAQRKPDGGSYLTDDLAKRILKAQIKHFWQLGVRVFPCFNPTQAARQAMNDVIIEVTPQLADDPALPDDTDTLGINIKSATTGDAFTHFQTLHDPETGALARGAHAMSITSAKSLLNAAHWFAGGDDDGSGPPPDLNNSGNSSEKLNLGSAIVYDGLPTKVPQGAGAWGMNARSANASGLAALGGFAIDEPLTLVCAYSLVDNATTQSTPARGQGTQAWLMALQDADSTTDASAVCLGISDGNVVMQQRRVVSSSTDGFLYQRTQETVNESNPGPLEQGILHVTIGTITAVDGEGDATNIDIYHDRVDCTLSGGGTGITLKSTGGFYAPYPDASQGAQYVRIYEAFALDYAVTEEQANQIYDQITSTGTAGGGIMLDNAVTATVGTVNGDGSFTISGATGTPVAGQIIKVTAGDGLGNAGVVESYTSGESKVTPQDTTTLTGITSGDSVSFAFSEVGEKIGRFT